MPIDLQKARELFLHAVGKLPPERWESYLAQACGGDAELKQQVEGLLQVHREAGSFLDAPALGLDATIAPPLAERPGTLIGPYKLIEQIGEGGMGTVWMAQQTEPVKRVVAIKLIKAGMDSRQVIARFEAERQALALMDHANIARVLEGGTTSAGRPYFVMDLVKGTPITKYCDEHHLTPRERLELFIPVCQAVQHAHQKGIIHRDLKPSNVLVALYDGKPVPKVIDFGVAKAAGQALTDKTLVTGFGNIVGTLEYMSPEQAEVNQLDIDTRSDIYSLGVLLYELLAGSPPFSRKELEKAGMLEMLRVIREEEPSKPSTKLSSSDALPSLSASRGTEPTKLTKLMRGELDWMVMKSLEKDRNRRYETANGLAMDVQRYLRDEPILACPPSAAYRLRKFVRRNKGLLVASAIVAFVLVAGTVLSTWQAIRATKAEWRAGELLTLEQKARRAADVARKQETRHRQIAEEARRAEAKQRRTADESTAKAQKNYEMARRAVQQMLTRVADEQLGAIPKMKEVRIQLLEDAAAFHAELLKINPEDARAYSQRAYVYSLLARYDQALADYNTGLELNPADAECNHNLAWFLVQCPDVAFRDYRRALEHAKRAVELAPRNAVYVYTLAITYKNLNDYKSALAEIERALDLDPTSSEVYYERSMIHRRFGDHEQALADALRAVELNPSSPWYHKTLADAYLDLGQGEKGLSAANRALELNATPNAVSTFYFYEVRGLAYRQLGNHQAAITDFNTAIELAPFRSWTYRERARSHFCLQHYEQALADIAKSLNLNPDDSFWILTEITPEEAAQCPDETFRHGLLGLIDLALQRSQNALGAYSIRTRFHVAGGQWDEAASDYSKLIELAPQSAKYRNEFAWLLATCPVATVRDPPRAVELAKVATRIRPEQGMYWNTLGAASYRAGDWKAAIAAVEKSMGLRHGGDSNDWFLLAMAYWQLGEKGTAREWNDKAIQWMDAHAKDNAELTRFRAEAEELMMRSE